MMNLKLKATAFVKSQFETEYEQNLELFLDWIDVNQKVIAKESRKGYMKGASIYDVVNYNNAMISEALKQFNLENLVVFRSKVKDEVTNIISLDIYVPGFGKVKEDVHINKYM